MPELDSDPGDLPELSRQPRLTVLTQIPGGYKDMLEFELTADMTELLGLLEKAGKDGLAADSISQEAEAKLNILYRRGYVTRIFSGRTLTGYRHTKFLGSKQKIRFDYS
jgi:hypothetical protein